MKIKILESAKQDLREGFHFYEQGWVEDALRAGGQLRDGQWSESIAVGSESFVTMRKDKLGSKAKGREVIGEDGSYVLQESPAPYNSILGYENDVLSTENGFFWEDNLCISTE